MKRMAIVLSTALVSVALFATQALAQQYPPSKAPGGTDATHGTNGTDVAFTGTNISIGLLIVAGLVLLGAILLVVSRRRKVGAAE